MTDPRTDALTFLKAHDLGALATVAENGDPRVRLLYYVTDDACNLYFMTLAHTRKSTEIRTDGRAAFTVASDDASHTLQIEGVFEEMTDTATFGPVLVELTKHLFPDDHAPAPITKFGTDTPVLFKLKPTWIRWADFTKEPGEVFSEILPA